MDQAGHPGLTQIIENYKREYPPSYNKIIHGKGGNTYKMGGGVPKYCSQRLQKTNLDSRALSTCALTPQKYMNLTPLKMATTVETPVTPLMVMEHYILYRVHKGKLCDL